MRTLNEDTMAVRTHLLNISEYYYAVKAILQNHIDINEDDTLVRDLSTLIFNKLKKEIDGFDINYDNVNVYALLDVFAKDYNKIFS